MLSSANHPANPTSATAVILTIPSFARQSARARLTHPKGANPTAHEVSPSAPREHPTEVLSFGESGSSLRDVDELPAGLGNGRQPAPREEEEQAALPVAAGRRVRRPRGPCGATDRGAREATP